MLDGYSQDWEKRKLLTPVSVRKALSLPTDLNLQNTYSTLVRGEKEQIVLRKSSETAEPEQNNSTKKKKQVIAAGNSLL